MGQSTSVERGTNSSIRQRPCLEKSLRDKEKFDYQKNSRAADKDNDNALEAETPEKGAQVFRSYHVKDRIDSLIEEYLTENTSTNDSVSDSEDNSHAVSSTEDPAQDPSSSSVNECDQGETQSVSANTSCDSKSNENGLRTSTPDGDRKFSVVDSTNAPPDSELNSSVDKPSHRAENLLKSGKMDGTSSLSMFAGSHGKPHTLPLANAMCGSNPSSDMPHWKSNTKKQIKLQTLIDKVLESSLGSPNHDDGAGLLKSLSEVENDEKEMTKLTSALKPKPVGMTGERLREDHRSKPSVPKAPKVDLGCSKDDLENFKTHIKKAVSARYEREKPANYPHISSPEPHMDHISAAKHKSVNMKSEMPANYNHSRHQEVKGVVNVQQIIERVIKEADSHHEFGDDRKRTKVVPSPNVPYSVHPSHLHRDNASHSVVSSRHNEVPRPSEPHNRHRDYHLAVSGYGVGPRGKVSEEYKRNQPVYQQLDRHHNSLGGNRDYRYNYSRSRPSHPQIPHSSPSRDMHPSRPQPTSYPSEHSAEMCNRSDSYSQKSYKRHSPPPLVRIQDSQGAHVHRQQYPSKYPSDQCLPPPAKMRKDHFHELSESNVPTSRDIYRAGQRMHLTANPMHGNNVRGADNIHMRPIYPMPVQMGLPFRGTLGPLPGPRSAAWIGGAEHSAIPIQQMRHPHPGQPVHVTPRYPVSKHPNGMPQRLPTQMMPSMVRKSPVPPHSMSHPTPTSNPSPSIPNDLKHRPPGSITKGTAPPPVETSQPPVVEPERRPGRSTEELPLDLSKKPSSTPSPAASSDGQDSGRLPNGEPNCMSTHIKSLEESVEKYFHDYSRSKVPLDRLPMLEGEHQIYLQHRLMAEAHHAQAQVQAQAHVNAQAQAHVHAQAQAHAYAIAQAQAHAHAQEQAHPQTQVQTQTQAQAPAHVRTQTQPQPQIHAQAQIQAQAQAQVQAQVQAQAQVHAQAQSFQMHSPNMRERTPSRDPSYSNSPRPQRQEPRVSPRQTSPQSSVIQSPVGNSLQVQESQVPQKTTSAPSPLPEDGNKPSKSMKQISKHEPIQSLLGNHAPNDILYLICRVCNQTYGSPYGFRRHFRNQHRFEPQAHHTLVQTISETRSALHPPGLEGSDLPPALEVQGSTGLQHPPANSDGQMDRMLDIDRHSPVAISDSLPEQKGLIANGVGSDSRPSSVMSGAEGKSDSSSGSEDKCLGSRSKLSSDPEDSQERRFLSCQECGEKFQLNDFGLYKKHCRAHEKERQGKYKCTDCRSSFCESHQMQDQQFRQGSTVKRSHLCHLCNLFFPNSTALAQHIEMDHRLEEIQQHELRQQGMQQSESYECIPCKQQFKDLQTYVEHQQVCPCAADASKVQNREEEKLSAQSCASVESPDASLGRNEDSQQAVRSAPNSPVVTTGDLVWKKKSAIKLSQPESNSSLAPVFVNGDSKDSNDESADLYRHKKFSRLPAKRRDSDLESLESVSGSSKKMKLDVPPVEDARRASSCSSTAPSPAGSSVRSACSSPNSAIDEPSVKTDFKKHSKFAKGMKYVTGLNTKGDASPSPDAGNSGSKSSRDKSKSDEGTTRVKRGDRKDKNKKSGGDKAEARHQLPFVWDRVTRSKAVKHAKK